jgi:RHH-type transcriptional regulator, rel operon repressor / antitoxin RelB
MTGLRVPQTLETRLNHLAHETKRSKSFYIRQAIEEFLEEHEDYLLASASYEEYLRHGKKGISLEKIKKKYKLNEDSY